METLFWVLLTLMLYSYFGYPMIVFAVSLVVRKPVHKCPIEPRITFLITAYNEEKSLRRKLINTLQLDYPRPKLDILVVSDGSTDATDALAREFAGSGVRLLRMPSRVGKTEAQNRAVRAARGEIIVFSDATTDYEASALRCLVRNFADRTVGAVGGRFRYIDPGKSSVGRGTVAFWDYESFIKISQTRIGTITGCSGCIYAVRRELYEPLPADIISDLVEPLKVIQKGYRVVYEPESMAYENAFAKADDEFAMRTRVITRGMRGFLYMRTLFNPFRHPFIALQLVSHKILRWFVPVLAVLLFAVSGLLAEHSMFYAVVFLVQMVFYLLALVGFAAEIFARHVSVLSFPLYFILINSASILAMIRVMSGKKDATWETVR